MEGYLDRIQESLQNLTPKHFHHNLTREETKTIDILASNQDLVIKSADKGSGIVVEDTENCKRRPGSPIGPEDLQRDRPGPHTTAIQSYQQICDLHAQERHHGPDDQRLPNLQRGRNTTNPTTVLPKEDTQLAEDDLLYPMETEATASKPATTTEEKDYEGEEEMMDDKDLLALRQRYKKTASNLTKIESHLSFITACVVKGHTPKGHQMQCPPCRLDPSQIQV